MPYSSRQVIRALERLGFQHVSQRGSHLKLQLHIPNGTRTVIVKVGARNPSGDVSLHPQTGQHIAK